jgi:uncharacterized protein YjbJ (UPF0337 family)
MTKLQEKAKGRAKQAVGQIVGNDRLVLDGKKQERGASAETNHGRSKEKKGVQRDQNTESSEQTVEPNGRKGPVLE